MAAQQKRSERSPARPARKAPAPTAADGRSAAARSPALEMQSQLAAELDAEGRWPAAGTLAFVTATCGAFWALVAFGISRLIH